MILFYSSKYSMQTIWNPFKNLHASMHKNGHDILKICTGFYTAIFYQKMKILNFKF